MFVWLHESDTEDVIKRRLAEERTESEVNFLSLSYYRQCVLNNWHSARLLIFQVALTVHVIPSHNVSSIEYNWGERVT